MRKRLPLLIRSADSIRLIDIFLVCSVVTILVIRLYLQLTGYPSVGGETFHIAHLLPGGFLMLAALLLMLSVLNSWNRTTAAVVGGIGFGFFIDELGKFITRDNDYFFKPTAALIYLIFLAIYFTSRYLFARSGLRPQEYLVNALEYLKDAGTRELDRAEREQALAYLAKADQRNPMVGPVRRLLLELTNIPPAQPNRLERLVQRGRETYLRIIQHRWFIRGTITFFLVIAALSLFEVVVLVFALADAIFSFDPEHLVISISKEGGHLSVLEWAQLISDFGSGTLMILGAIRLRRNRLEAYRFFYSGLLVTIFIGQVFAFASEEFVAAISLIFYLVLLATVRYMIRREELAPGLPATAGSGQTHGSARKVRTAKK